MYRFKGCINAQILLTKVWEPKYFLIWVYKKRIYNDENVLFRQQYF